MNKAEEIVYQYHNQKVKLYRYPYLKEGSLKIYNAADELILNELNHLENNNILTIHDRYGFISKIFSLNNQLSSIVSYNSQMRAFKLNDIEQKIKIYKLSEEVHSKFDIIIIKLPKSLELYDFYLNQIQKYRTPNTIVYVLFMTRHFTDKILKISSNYFKKLEQSKIVKKARILKLSETKQMTENSLDKSMSFQEIDLQTTAGMFAKSAIDKATKFLLENLNEKQVSFTGNGIDLGSGSGLISFYLKRSFPELEIIGIEDYYLSYLKSVETAKKNSLEIEFLWSDSLNNIADNSQDFIISNPPFHFEHINTVEISFSLFKEAKRVLKKGAFFIIVYNNHLNYLSFLKSLFNCMQLAKNDKFTVIRCYKT